METDKSLTNTEERNFADLEDRLNDREPRTPSSTEPMERDNFLDSYPREAINDELVDEDKIAATRQRVIAEVNESQNDAAVETEARRRLEQENLEDAYVEGRQAIAPRKDDQVTGEE